MASKGMQKFLHLIGFGDDEPYEEPRSAYTPPARSQAPGNNPYRQSARGPVGAAPRQEARPEPRAEARPDYRAESRG